MVAVDHPTVTAAVTELKEKGVPVFSLLSDFASGVREGYVGLNNRKAGRTAAWIIARTSKRPGKVVVFVGSHRFHGHEMREIGFRSYFREYAPEFELVETMVNLEDRRIAHEATLDLLQRFPDLAGFYVAGGGMEGAIAALRDENMAGRLIVVCNELTPESRAALADNIVTAVIATPIARLSRRTRGADGASHRKRRHPGTDFPAVRPVCLREYLTGEWNLPMVFHHNGKPIPSRMMES